MAQRLVLALYLSEKRGNEPHSLKQAYQSSRAETGFSKHPLWKSIEAAYLAIY